MLALIDADVITYRVGFAAQHTWYLVWRKGDEAEFGFVARFRYKKDAMQFMGDGDEFYLTTITDIEPIEFCLHSVKAQLQSILSEVEATGYKLFLTGDIQLRDDLAKTKPYKGNRDPLHKPHYYADIKKYLREHWNAVTVDVLEADDAMAIEQVRNQNAIICTIDKDLDQIPGWHYNFVKKEKYYVTNEEAKKWFYIQVLAGDSTDNIQGIRGIGPAKAAKLLDKCTTDQEYYEVCLKNYEEAYKEKGKEVLIEMANLVYIRTSAEQLFWVPPK